MLRAATPPVAREAPDARAARSKPAHSPGCRAARTRASALPSPPHPGARSQRWRAFPASSAHAQIAARLDARALPSTGRGRPWTRRPSRSTRPRRPRAPHRGPNRSRPPCRAGRRGLWPARPPPPPPRSASAGSSRISGTRPVAAQLRAGRAGRRARRPSRRPRRAAVASPGHSSTPGSRGDPLPRGRAGRRALALSCRPQCPSPWREPRSRAAPGDRSRCAARPLAGPPRAPPRHPHRRAAALPSLRTRPV